MEPLETKEKIGFKPLFQEIQTAPSAAQWRSWLTNGATYMAQLEFRFCFVRRRTKVLDLYLFPGLSARVLAGWAD